MVSIPTPIPQYWVTRFRRFRSASLSLLLWRLLLIAVGVTLLALALASTWVFAGVLAGLIASVVLSDDVRATIRDIWDLNFWRYEP